MKNGYGAPFVRIYYKDKELGHAVEKFKYTYDEENPDECTLSVNSLDTTLPDLPEFQEGAELRVLWGYIGGKTKTRKVYIQDIKPSFEKRGVILDITATDKSIELRKSNSRKLHKKGDVLGLTAGIAKKHGISAYIEYGPNNTASFKGFLEELNKNKPQPKKRPAYRSSFLENAVGALFLQSNRDRLARDAQKLQYELEETVGFNKGVSPTRILLSNYDDFVAEIEASRKVGRVPSPQFFRSNPYFTELYLKSLRAKQAENSDQTPQAGKTDHQIIREKLNGFDNEPYVLDSRDDSLTIRKRNFDQVPYRKFVYKGEDGHLLSFTPVTKTKSRSSSNNAVQYSSWDPVNKTFETRKVDSSTSATKSSLSTFLTGDLDKIYVPQIFMGRVLGTPTPSDNTQTVNSLRIERFQGQSKEDFVKSLLGPRATSQIAQGVRDNAELQMNPGSALHIGDPDIEVGQIITYENVSKKYSGNYYITKSIHTIEKSTGYETFTEFTRQGVNVKAKPNTISSKDAKKAINKQFGVTNQDIRKKIINKRNKR